MTGAIKDFLAIIEDRLPSKAEHDNHRTFCRDTSFLADELLKIVSTKKNLKKRTASQMETGSVRDRDNQKELPTARVIVAIDEAGDYFARRAKVPSRSGRTSLHVFTCVISQAVDYPVAFTVMSTSPSVCSPLMVDGRALLADWSISSRERDNLVIPAPFTQLSFDTFAYDDDKQCGIANENLTLEDVSETEFIIKFGRPL
jgi:hypothetical protein